MDNAEFARLCAHVAKRATDWAFDLLTIKLDSSALDSDVERFKKDIRDILELYP